MLDDKQHKQCFMDAIKKRHIFSIFFCTVYSFLAGNSPAKPAEFTTNISWHFDNYYQSILYFIGWKLKCVKYIKMLYTL